MTSTEELENAVQIDDTENNNKKRKRVATKEPRKKIISNLHSELIIKAANSAIDGTKKTSFRGKNKIVKAPVITYKATLVSKLKKQSSVPLKY
jgi:hypothetical protein